MKKTAYLVVPCYNEEEVLKDSASVLKEKMQSLIERELISEKSKICFVDDGSKDSTWSIIEGLTNSDKIFASVKLSRNRGHQNALLGGLMTVKNDCDATISLDADLQDDINAIDEMIIKFNNGADIVYGVRNDRTKDSFMKKATAQGFYKLMNFMGASTIYNHADFRLMSKRALDAFADFKEVNLYLRGMVTMVGFNQDVVYYERQKRMAGESKYNLSKMLSLAFDGITSFSVKPLRLIFACGICFSAVGFIMFLTGLSAKVFSFTVSRNHMLCALIWLMSGINLAAMGTVGEYIGKIYSEVKARPRYIIEKYINNKD